MTIGVSDPEHRRSSNLQLQRGVNDNSTSSQQPVSALWARMIEEMIVRGFSEKTRNDYIRNVRVCRKRRAWDRCQPEKC